MSSVRRKLPIRRDTVLFVAGLAGIGYQQYTERVSLPLLIMFGVMAGVPGFLGGLEVLFATMRSTQQSPGPIDSHTVSSPSDSVP